MMANDADTTISELHLKLQEFKLQQRERELYATKRIFRFKNFNCKLFTCTLVRESLGLMTCFIDLDTDLTAKQIEL
jgi:hypothetical protein